MVSVEVLWVPGAADTDRVGVSVEGGFPIRFVRSTDVEYVEGATLTRNSTAQAQEQLYST